MSPHAPVSLTRRTAWSGLLAGTAALTGCDLVSSEEPAGAPSPDEPEAAPDADTDLVAAVSEDINEIQILVSRVVDRHRRLRPDLAALRRLHREHLTALNAQEGYAGPGDRVGDAQEALALVRRRELTLQRRLVDHAVAARSGRLARLLASMSAGVAQELAVLPSRVPAGADR